MLVSLIACSANVENKQKKQISLESLLESMRDLSHLPELLDAKTAMSSTWDREGKNRDGFDFKRIEGRYNILLDMDGPGVVHRIFTGKVPDQDERFNRNEMDMNRTHLQIFIDHQLDPVIDIPVRDFFTKNPFTNYPFVFGHDRTYPGFLLPIPFNKHIKVQLWSLDESPVFRNWGNFWQVTYTTYTSEEVEVKSFDLPLLSVEKQQMEKTGSDWINAEKNTPLETGKWEKEVTLDLTDKKKREYILNGPGVIDALRIDISPNTPEALKDVRFRIYWNGMPFPSVDVPLGYFFGSADYASKEMYHSLFMGIDRTGGYSCFPMPFSETARIEFSIPDKSTVKHVDLKLNYRETKINDNQGYFHTTWTEQYATSLNKRGQEDEEAIWNSGWNIPGMPKYGEQNVPTHIVMDRKGFKGKYVGLLLHVAWPGGKGWGEGGSSTNLGWWGEGDPLIWTDENGWPPSYHGTGSEEYFNSGWCDFDRKAISGYIKKRPGNVLVYSFHINDAFNFKNNFKFGIERWNLFQADDLLENIWGSTAFWYAEFPLPAESKQQLLAPRLDDLSEPVGWK